MVRMRKGVYPNPDGTRSAGSSTEGTRPGRFRNESTCSRRLVRHKTTMMTAPYWWAGMSTPTIF